MDNKECLLLLGNDEQCCKGCHGEEHNTFLWKDHKVCCAVWLFLDGRDGKEGENEEVVH